MKRFFIAFGVCFVALAVILAWSLHRQNQADAEAPESSGVVEATRISLAARINARITKLHFAEGSGVKAGDVMAEFDCEDLAAQRASADARAAASEAQYAALRAQSSAAKLQADAAIQTTAGQQAQLESLAVQAKQAQKENERTVTLFKNKVVNESTIDMSQSTVDDLQKKIVAANRSVEAAGLNAQAAAQQSESLKSQVISLQNQAQASRAEALRVAITMKECQMLAPVNAVVSLRAREEGESVGTGMLVYELRDMSALKARFFIRNSSLSKVTIGDLVTIKADSFADQSFTAKVVRISEEASFTPRSVQTRDDRDRLVYAAEAAIEDPTRKLRPGMALEVFFQKR